MKIRRACEQDIPGLNRLLEQVLQIHHEGRPDIFRQSGKKYTDTQLLEILLDESRPIFVAVEEEQILGYAFCIWQQHREDHVLTDIRTLYIDDLCVEQELRGEGIGQALFGYVKEYAKENGFYNVTLNVWSCNPTALRFYEKCGLQPQKIGMELVL